MDKKIFDKLPFYLRQFDNELAEEEITYAENNHIWIRIVKNELDDDLLTINLYLDYVSNNDEHMLFLESEMHKDGYGDDENKENWKAEFAFDNEKELYEAIAEIIINLQKPIAKINDQFNKSKKILGK